MNAEIIKAMNKKEKKNNLRKWWNKNGYKVLRVIFFPIWIAGMTKEKIDKWLDSRESWNENRVKEILDYYIPRRSEWDNCEKEFYFFDNGYGWSLSLAKKHLKRKDRRFWENYNGFCGGKIREYLIHNYELEGFTKEVLNISDGWTEICFTLNEN